MQQIIFLIHILAAVGLIAMVLLQHGKGADMGTAFGSGASGTIFGSVGALPFLVKVTAFFAILFFVSSLSLGFYIAKQAKSQGQSVIVPPNQTAPMQQAPIKQDEMLADTAATESSAFAVKTTTDTLNPVAAKNSVSKKTDGQAKHTRKIVHKKVKR